MKDEPPSGFCLTGIWKLESTEVLTLNSTAISKPFGDNHIPMSWTETQKGLAFLESAFQKNPADLMWCGEVRCNLPTSLKACWSLLTSSSGLAKQQKYLPDVSRRLSEACSLPKPELEEVLIAPGVVQWQKTSPHTLLCTLLPESLHFEGIWMQGWAGRPIWVLFFFSQYA